MFVQLYTGTFDPVERVKAAHLHPLAACAPSVFVCGKKVATELMCPSREITDEVKKRLKFMFIYEQSISCLRY